MPRICFVVLLLLLSSTGSAAQPDLKLPYTSGESWQLTRAYDVGTHVGLDIYALDFALSGCGSWDKPILAAAGGTVTAATYSDGYGNYVDISHGDGYWTRYAHLKTISVAVNDAVLQGQEIGRCGNSGNASGSSCPEHPGTHLH